MNLILSPQFLEAINGYLLVEFVVILYLFFRYIAQGIYTYGWEQGRRQRAAAIGVFTLILGDAIIRLSVWLWRHHVNTTGNISAPAEAWVTVGTTIGVVVAAIGGACVIRYFSPTRWGEWPWILSMVFGAAWSIYMAW